MDSTFLQMGDLISTGYPVLDTWAPQILALIVIPLLHWLNKVKMVDALPTIGVGAAICIGVVFIIRAVSAPEMSAKEALDFGLQMSVSAALTHRIGGPMLTMLYDLYKRFAKKPEIPPAQ